ncbi:MAG: hypothetical protein KF864_13755 [Phycisphaeraceae bacterium]|nr:hypothetical protein [Phycisphaeraceae bacterium]MBX3387409.1 hypothetical protein [Phycisphaeraceae bacterium]
MKVSKRVEAEFIRTELDLERRRAAPNAIQPRLWWELGQYPRGRQGGPQQENDIARHETTFPAAEAETSALDQETSGLQPKDLIRNAEIRGLNKSRDGKRRLKIPSNRDGDKQRHDKQTQVLRVAFARDLLTIGHRHMEMAPTLVKGMKQSAVRAIIVTRRFQTAAIAARVSIAMPAGISNRRVVAATVPKGYTQHPTRTRSHHALHNEQEHGDEFDEGWGHLRGVSAGKSIPLQPALGSVPN